MLLACSEMENGEESMCYASFNGSIEAVNTRAHDTEWDAGDEIGVSVETSGGATVGTNVKYTTAAGDGKFSSAAPIVFADTKPVTFTAYYPYSNSSVISVSTEAKNQSSEAQKQIDYMFARGIGSKVNPNVGFEFKHCMSQVTLTFSKGDVESLSGMRFSLSGLKLQGSFNAATGVVSAV
jgi:hypothetical protein